MKTGLPFCMLSHILCGFSGTRKVNFAVWGDFSEAQLPYRFYFKHCRDAFDAMSFLTLAHSICPVLQSFTSLRLLFPPCDNFKGNATNKTEHFLS